MYSCLCFSVWAFVWSRSHAYSEHVCLHSHVSHRLIDFVFSLDRNILQSRAIDKLAPLFKGLRPMRRPRRKQQTRALSKSAWRENVKYCARVVMEVLPNGGVVNDTIALRAYLPVYERWNSQHKGNNYKHNKSQSIEVQMIIRWSCST